VNVAFGLLFWNIHQPKDKIHKSLGILLATNFSDPVLEVVLTTGAEIICKLQYGTSFGKTNHCILTFQFNYIKERHKHYNKFYCVRGHQQTMMNDININQGGEADTQHKRSSWIMENSLKVAMEKISHNNCRCLGNR